MRGSGADSDTRLCVMNISPHDVHLFPASCSETSTIGGGVKMCCPPDTLLSREASAAWETGKSGIYARVERRGSSTLYVGDRGGVVGGAFVMRVGNDKSKWCGDH